MNLNFFKESYFPLIPLASAEEEIFSPEAEKEWLQGINEHPQYQIKILKDVSSKWYWIPLFFTGIGALFVFYKFVVKLQFRFNCAKISVAGTKYYLSIANIAKKTLLDRSQIIEHEKNGTLWTVLKNKICELDFTNSPAFERIPEKVKGVFLQNLPNIVKNKGIVEDSEDYFIAQYNKKRVLKVVRMPKKSDVIATGTVSILKRIEDLTVIDGFLAIKTQHDHDIENPETQKARAELNQQTREGNDQATLTDIIADQSVRTKFNTPKEALYGVQEPAEMSINIDLTDGRKILATIEREYNGGDLYKWLRKKRTQPQLINCSINTLKALSIWWKGKKPHGDIKIENICTSADKIRVIDLPRKTAIEDLDYIHTAALTAQQDSEEINELIDRARLLEGTERKKLEALYEKKLFKTDVFAAGVTLYNILTNGEEPFEESGDYFIPKEVPFDDHYLRELNYSENLIAAIREMVRANPNDRMDIKKVTKTLLPLLEAELKLRSI